MSGYGGGARMSSLLRSFVRRPFSCSSSILDLNTSTRALCQTPGRLDPPKHLWSTKPASHCNYKLLWTSWQRSLTSEAGTPNKDEEYPPLPEYNVDPVPEHKDIYIVHAKGLPWSCTREDLLEFFEDCRICDGVQGIHLMRGSDGRPNGKAFIEMEREQDVRRALEKHKMYLGPRYVEVYEVTDREAEAILKGEAELQGSCVVSLRGLPFHCTVQDILLFFEGLHIEKHGVLLVLDKKGRSTGKAFVRFASHEMATEALKRDKDTIGNRFIDIFPSTALEMLSINERSRGEFTPKTSHHKTPSVSKTSYGASQQHQRNDNNIPESAADPSSPVSFHHVHMRGLPFHATAKDIVQFFSPLRVERILLEFGPKGLSTGEAEAFFLSHEDAVAAMAKDKYHMENRYIELFLNSSEGTEV